MYSFRAHDSLEINSLSRPLHVMLLTIPHLIKILLFQDEPIALNYARIASYFALMSLPFQWVCITYFNHYFDKLTLIITNVGWFIYVFYKKKFFKFQLMGFLPLFEPLLLWLVEQIQVFLFGGTPTPSFFRCMGQISVSLVHFGIIMTFQNNQWLAVILRLVHTTCY